LKNFRMWLPVLLVFGLFMVNGCAGGPNSAVDTPCESGSIAGFWLGLWHGMISCFTFIISLFEKSVGFYEVHNNGALYNLGFLLGVGTLFGGLTSTASRRR